MHSIVIIVVILKFPVEDNAISRHILAGNTLEKPAHCPSRVYELCIACFADVETRKVACMQESYCKLVCKFECDSRISILFRKDCYHQR